ncbi:hypothetical protein ACVWYQ_003304 [Bradyrhizobium sp. USDA 3397]
MIRNLACRPDRQWPGAAANILEGLDAILIVVRSKLPSSFVDRSPCTKIAENIMGTIRRVTHNVKGWRESVWPCNGRCRYDRGQQASGD